MGISAKAMGWFQFRVWSDGRKMMMARLVGFDKNWGFGLQVRVLVWVDGFEWIRIGNDR